MVDVLLMRAVLRALPEGTALLLVGDVDHVVAYMAEGHEVDGTPSERETTLLHDGAQAHDLTEHYIRFLENVEHAA